MLYLPTSIAVNGYLNSEIIDGVFTVMTQSIVLEVVESDRDDIYTTVLL